MVILDNHVVLEDYLRPYQIYLTRLNMSVVYGKNYVCSDIIGERV